MSAQPETSFTLEDGGWAEHVYETAEDVIAIASVGIEVPVADLYEGVAFGA